jgi:DNA-binding LacI/PurR family transcriptional regulator
MGVGMPKRITLNDVAKELNISKTTVSKALNDHPDISEKRKKEISELLKSYNYIPNAASQNLRNRTSKLISVVVTDNSNPYYSQVVRGAENVLSGYGFHTVIFNNHESSENEIDFIKDMISLNVAGVLLTPSSGDSETVRLLRLYNIPYVLVHRYFKKNEDNYVVADDFKAAYIGTNYLMENRFKNIVFLNGNTHVSVAKDRLEGYKAALKDHGVEFDEGRVYPNIMTDEDGYKIIKTVLNVHQLPLSILCFSDYVATGVMRQLYQEKIKMPDQVALMGIDDIELFAYYPPGLSTVHLPKTSLGKISAELLISLIKTTEDVTKTRIVLPPRLVIRGSA